MIEQNKQNLEAQYTFHKKRLTFLAVLNLIFLSITLYTLMDVSVFTVFGVVSLLTVGVLYVMTNRDLSKVIEEMDAQE